MLRFYSSLLALVLTLPALAAPADTNAYFENLAAQAGSFHQATIAVATKPTAETLDLKKHDENSTLTIQKLSEDKYVVQAFAKEEKKATASSMIIERKDGKVFVTYLDLNNVHQAYRVEARIGSAGTELSYYQSDVKYLETSPEASEKRKKSFQEKQVAITALILVLAVGGQDVSAEVIGNEDYITALVVRDSGIINSEIYLDPRGKSELKPKGEPSLTILQAFHKEE